MIRIRISDPRSLGSWYIKWTDESILDKDSSAHLIYHDPSDLGITDPDPDHPKGTHPWSPAFPVFNDLAEAHWEVYVDICDVSFKYSRETWSWSRRTITRKLQETNKTICSSQIVYHELNRNQERCWERWMLYEAFKRRKNTTLLKRFVLWTTEFHQHIAKSTTSY